MRHEDNAGRSVRIAATRMQAQRGVTLVEVMATTAISAIILGIAAPSYVDQVRANRTRSAAQQLSALLQEARTESMKRNVPVLVCPSSDGASCLATPTAASWADRTIVCFDVNGDGACDTSSLEAPNPIRVRGRIDGSVTLTGPAATVRFNGMGATANSVNFSLSAGSGQSQSSTITVATTGSVRSY